jgi:hypothetical protein
LSARATLLAFAPWFSVVSRRARRLASRWAGAWSVVTSAGSARSLGAWSARADASSHPGLAFDATKHPGLGLFDHFDFGIIAVDAEVGESPIGRLFN